MKISGNKEHVHRPQTLKQKADTYIVPISDDCHNPLHIWEHSSEMNSKRVWFLTENNKQVYGSYDIVWSVSISEKGKTMQNCIKAREDTMI